MYYPHGQSLKTTMYTVHTQGGASYRHSTHSNFDVNYKRNMSETKP